MRIKIDVSESVDPNSVDKLVEKQLEEMAYDLAEYVVDVTANIEPNGRNKPAVDTGAFITSWSFSTGAGRPRGKSSHRRPRKQNPLEMRQDGLDLLHQDIQKLDFKKVLTEGFIVRNGAPHAKYVDLKHGYGIEAKVKVYGKR